MGAPRELCANLYLFTVLFYIVIPVEEGRVACLPTPLKASMVEAGSL